MTKCGIGAVLGTECGFAVYRDKNAEVMLSINECRRDITGHLKMFNLRGLANEGELIMCRAGTYVRVNRLLCYYLTCTHAETLQSCDSLGIFGDTDLVVCPKHRDNLGIYWRGRQRRCQIPQSLANHPSNQPKGDRTVSKSLSQAVFKQIGVLVPIGSGNDVVTVIAFLITNILNYMLMSSDMQKMPRNIENGNGKGDADSV